MQRVLDFGTSIKQCIQNVCMARFFFHGINYKCIEILHYAILLINQEYEVMCKGSSMMFQVKFDSFSVHFLQRGKFRPRLTELIKSNSEKDIKEITSKSYGHIKEPEAAIKELCKLKGVGPATASGESGNIFISRELLQELISQNL